MNIIVWLILAALTGALNVILVKQYITTKEIKYIPIVLLSGLTTLYSYYKIFNTSDVSKAYPIVKIISILMVILFGIVMCDEKITFKSSCGIALSIIAMYLLLCK